MRVHNSTEARAVRGRAGRGVSRRVAQFLQVFGITAGLVFLAAAPAYAEKAWDLTEPWGRATFSTFVTGAKDPSTASAQAEQAVARIMTWNVRTRNFGSDDWNKVVGNQKPDIVGFQEICVREAKDLRKLLKEKYQLEYHLALGSVREGRYPGCDPIPGLRGAYGQALLSKFPISDTTNVPLRDDDGVDEPRGYMAVTVDIPGRGSTRVFNTHIAVGSNDEDSQQREALKIQQLKQLAEDAQNYPQALVMGDFNVRPENVALAPLVKAGFVEVDRGDPPKPTSHNKHRERDSAADAKIDYIFMRGFETVGEPETYWVASSDHRPLIANLR